jgi:hypothetical protein
MDTAFKVAGPSAKRQSSKPDVTNTILVTPRLAFPDQLIEISMAAIALGQLSLQSMGEDARQVSLLG